MIQFNEPPFSEKAISYIASAVGKRHICGDGEYTEKCSKWIESNISVQKCLLTTSCTHALEMSAYLAGIGEGDEVILPSYTFASTADAFAIRGAKLVFVDIRPDTMNIDESLIENAITSKTKAIVVVHYAGVSCEMEAICEIANKYGLIVIEDAAQALLSTYRGKSLGSFGDFGCFSFHETKNFSMGEGGAIVFNDIDQLDRAEIIREKGTNRSKFWRGEIDKYTWVDIGSSYLPSEINAAYLWAQFEESEEIEGQRMKIWRTYYKGLSELAKKGVIDLPVIPEECTHNAHMFYIKCKGEIERGCLIKYLDQAGIKAVFHYIPLHIAPAGRKYGRFHGEDRYTTSESLKLLRLPLHQNIKESDVKKVIEKVKGFYNRI